MNRPLPERLIAPALLWEQGVLRKKRVLELEGGAVRLIRDRAAGDHPDATPHLLTPGLVDLQVNGGGGAMLNGAEAEGLDAILTAHRGLGAGCLLATLITDAPEAMTRAVDLICEMRDAPGLLGMHIEGPHINPAKRGTHDPRFIRPFDAITRAALDKLRAADIPVMLTLAPEMVASDDIRACAEMGVVVSLGHSAATAEQGRAGFAAGARCATHLFNAMPPMLSRDPGLLGAALDSEAFCSIIADGVHVCDEMIRIALRARPLPGRSFLISDAMATVGGPDRFRLYDQIIALKDGRLVNAEGALAGAHLDMASAVRHVALRCGIGLEEALTMAIDTPIAAMGLPAPSLRGAPLDMLTAFDSELRVIPL